MELFYNEIANTDDIRFSEAIQIYNESFPSNERQPLAVIIKRIKKGNAKLYVGYHKDEIVCIALLYHFNRSDFVFLDYMAVIKKFRDHKIGSSFFSFLLEKVV